MVQQCDTGGRSQDGGVGRCGVRVSSKLEHLPGVVWGPWTPKGMGGIPKQPGKMWGWGRRRGDRMGLAPQGMAGGGEGFPRSEGPTHRAGISGDGRDLQGIGGSEGKEASISPACSIPSKPTRVPGLNLSPPGPPPSVLSLSPAPPHSQGLFRPWRS